jgi:hypothetical protein
LDDIPAEGGEAEWKKLDGGEGRLNVKVCFTKDVGGADDNNAALLTIDEDEKPELDEDIIAGFKEVKSSNIYMFSFIFSRIFVCSKSHYFCLIRSSLRLLVVKRNLEVYQNKSVLTLLRS